MLHEAQAASAPGFSSGTHHPAKAKAVIHDFLSRRSQSRRHLDYKPELTKRQGKPFDEDGKMQFFASKPGIVREVFGLSGSTGNVGVGSAIFPEASGVCG